MQRYFTFNPSRQFALCIFLGHTVALGALYFVPLPQPAFALLLIVLFFSASYFVARDARLKLAGSWTGLRLEEQSVVLFNRKGDDFSGALLPSSVITPYLVILNIALPDFRFAQNVVLLPDSMEAESFRQLRVVLKWGDMLNV